MSVENIELKAEVARLRSELALAQVNAPIIRGDLPASDVPSSTPVEEIAASTRSAATEASQDGPLITIACVTRNAERFLPRAIAGMRAQTYRNVEIVVQDGGSTDRTLEIIRDEGLATKLVSEPDHGTTHGLLTLAERAVGDIVAVCWADDELMPHALGWAAAMFARHDDDVIYGDTLVMFDDHGAEQLQVGQEWDLERFSRQMFFPPFAATFFKRDALLNVARHRNTTDEDEYDLWLWLGLLHKMRHAPGLVSRFHVHGETRWTKPGYCEPMAAIRRRAIRRIAVDPVATAFVPLANEAAIGNELWAALHEISLTRSIEHSLSHLERIQKRGRPDFRYGLTLARLIGRSMSSDMDEIDRILRVARALGLTIGVVDTN